MTEIPIAAQPGELRTVRLLQVHTAEVVLPDWLVPPTVPQLLREQDGVIAREQALFCGMSVAQLEWTVTSGRWQRPFARAYVSHSGPLSPEQLAWAAWASAWPDGVVGFDTAATLDGLRGFETPETHLVLPPWRQLSKRDGLVPHRTIYLGDVHPVHMPPRTRLPRSLVDMAGFRKTLDDAIAVLAAGVQQRLVRAADLHAEIERRPKYPRREQLLAVCQDLAGGSHSVIEVEAIRLIRRYHLPTPSRQVPLTLPDGLARVDCYWDEHGLVVEIDGRMHMDPAQWIADLDRQNELTLGVRRVLRYPLWALRFDHARVADQLRRALTSPASPSK